MILTGTYRPSVPLARVHRRRGSVTCQMNALPVGETAVIEMNVTPSTQLAAGDRLETESSFGKALKQQEVGAVAYVDDRHR